MRNYSADEIVKIQSHLRKHAMVLLSKPTPPNIALAKAIKRELDRLDSDLSKLMLKQAIEATNQQTI